MHSVQTERYSFSLFNWEIALIFCWTNLRYIVIFTIDSYQERFWSASLDIDCNTPICTCIDTENLAETFIGKLLSGEQNQTDWKSFQQCITFAKRFASVNTLLRLIFTSTRKLSSSNGYSKAQIQLDGFQSNLTLPHSFYHI